jgi:hypothetical protein
MYSSPAVGSRVVQFAPSLLHLILELDKNTPIFVNGCSAMDELAFAPFAVGMK